MSPPLRELFRLNRRVLGVADYARLLAIEAGWQVPLRVVEVESKGAMRNRSDLVDALAALVELERAPTAAARFLAAEATLMQLRTVVAEFAVDGLTEAQSFFSILARVPPAVQAPLMRVFIDEFGCGNLGQMHSQLYRSLLVELGLPIELERHVETAGEEMFSFVNLFHWLGSRAPSPEYFLGALAYLEASVPSAFASFVEACERLGIRNHHYYTEHIHIDAFHARELLLAMRHMDDGTMAYNKAWAGARVTSEVVAAAFGAAVARARGEG